MPEGGRERRREKGKNTHTHQRNAYKSILAELVDEIESMRSEKPQRPVNELVGEARKLVIGKKGEETNSGPLGK